MHKKSLSMQTVFDLVASHLLKQRVRSCAGDDCSLYLDADGRRCAVGIFLSDEDALLLEGVPVTDEEVLGALTIDATPGIRKLLKRLQELHDDVLPELWRGRLKSIAKAYKLSTARIR